MELNQMQSGLSRERTSSTEPQGGFTYAEILVAMLILTLALLALAPLFTHAMRELSASTDLTFATMAAQNKAEVILTEDFGALSDGQDTYKSGPMTYSRTWTVDNDVPQAGMKTVTITVVSSREGVTGTNHTVTKRIYHVP